MFVNVESFFLHTFGNAEAVDFVESFEDDESHACCPCAYYECTEYLRSEKAPACTVKQSLTGGKQSGEDGSRDRRRRVRNWPLRGRQFSVSGR